MRSLAKTNWREVPIAYFDLETTGLDHDECRIIQFGGVVCQLNQNEQHVIKDIDLMINPGVPFEEVDPIIWKITQLDPDEVYSGPTFNEALPQILDFFEGAVIYSGWNIIKFDLPVLQNHFNRAGLALPPKYVLDLIFWYRHYRKKMGRATQKDAAQAFGARKFAETVHGKGNLHNASDDAQVAADIARVMSQSHITCWDLETLKKDQEKIVKQQLDYLEKKYGPEPYFTDFTSQEEVNNMFMEEE